LRRLLSRNYRIVTDRRKGQSVFGGSRCAAHAPLRCVSTQFHHDCTDKNANLWTALLQRRACRAISCPADLTDGPDLQIYRRVASAAPLPFQRGSGAL